MNDVKEIERSIIKKFRKEIWRRFVRGVENYQLVSEGDKIAVCISGGKDSFLMAKCLEELKRHGKVNFDLEFIVMDPGYNEVNRKLIMENSERLGLNVHVFDSDIFSVTDKVSPENPCYLCARMRRGFLYDKAQSLGCNKIALGHHFDDVVETIVMSMFYGAEVKTMMPKLNSTNFGGMELIRPLYLVHEEDIIAWAKFNDLFFLNCACKFTEKNETLENSSKRKEIKNFIKEYKKINPNIDLNIFRSVENINLRTVIGYHKDDYKYNFLDDYEKYRSDK